MAGIQVNNLAHFKKLMQLGTEYRIVTHHLHPEYAGLIRVVTKVQKNCVYSKIKDQPEHKYSLVNNGLGIRMDFEKASQYAFGDTVKVFIRRGDERIPAFELEIMKIGEVEI